MAHLYRVILPVSGIDRAASFYATVLGSPGRRVSPGRHYFECEGTILACFDPEADGDGYAAQPNPEPLYFAVSHLPSVYAACKDAGAVFATASPPGVGPLGEIARRPWGEESFYATDPFGNPICFVARTSVFRGQATAMSTQDDEAGAFFEPDGAHACDPIAAVRSCIEHGRRALLLDHGALPPAFFDLRTGLAGELVQKLVNYEVRMAAVVPDLAAHPERFREFAGEANRGRQFRFFATREAAIDWLCSE